MTGVGSDEGGDCGGSGPSLGRNIVDRKQPVVRLKQSNLVVASRARKARRLRGIERPLIETGFIGSHAPVGPADMRDDGTETLGVNGTFI